MCKIIMKLVSLSEYVRWFPLFRITSRFMSECERVIPVHSTNHKKVLRYNSKPYCIPPINSDIVDNISSVLSLNIGLTFVSWARIETKDNKVTHLDFQILPQNINKMEQCDLYTTVLETIELLPSADFYVMESSTKIVSGIGGRVQLTFQATRMQFTAMLVALLNYTRKNDYGDYSVIFLKQRLHGKLFNLTVGAELVSSKNIVYECLKGNDAITVTPIRTLPEVLNKYAESNSVEKEIMGQAFLTALTFTELVVHVNEKFYKKLFYNSKTTISK